DMILLPPLQLPPSGDATFAGTRAAARFLDTITCEAPPDQVDRAGPHREDVGRDHRRDGVRIIRRKVRGRGRRLHPPRSAVALRWPRQRAVWWRYDLETAIAGRHPIPRKIRGPERGATRIRHDHRRRPID